MIKLNDIFPFLKPKAEPVTHPAPTETEGYRAAGKLLSDEDIRRAAVRLSPLRRHSNLPSESELLSYGCNIAPTGKTSREEWVRCSQQATVLSNPPLTTIFTYESIDCGRLHREEGPPIVPSLSETGNQAHRKPQRVDRQLTKPPRPA